MFYYSAPAHYLGQKFDIIARQLWIWKIWHVQNTLLLLDLNRLLWPIAGNGKGKQKPKCSIFPLAKDKLQLITDFGTKGNLKHTCSLIANIDTNKENSY